MRNEPEAEYHENKSREHEAQNRRERHAGKPPGLSPFMHCYWSENEGEDNALHDETDDQYVQNRPAQVHFCGPIEGCKGRSGCGAAKHTD